jgi:hypothetical protein
VGPGSRARLGRAGITLGRRDCGRRVVPARNTGRHPLFHPADEAIATALWDQLLDLGPHAEIAVVNGIDVRLAEQGPYGWR